MTAERFEVVANLLDITHRRRIRLRVQVPKAAKIATLFDLQEPKRWSEVFDMFGIEFDGHPDPQILMLKMERLSASQRFPSWNNSVQFKAQPHDVDI